MPRPTVGVNAIPNLVIVRTNVTGAESEHSPISVATAPNEDDVFSLRLRNNTNRTATWGILLGGNSHTIDPTVNFVNGKLTSGKWGPFPDDAAYYTLNAGPVPATGGTAIQFNVSIGPFQYLEIRGKIVWSALANNPTVNLIPEIAGEWTLVARIEPDGTPSVVVAPAGP